jgi:ribosome biogenesis GTPase A
MQDSITKQRTLVITSLFPEEEIATAIMKAAQGFNRAQFIELYKFLLTERTNLNKIFEEGLEQEKPVTVNSADRTMEILKAKYGDRK